MSQQLDPTRLRIGFGLAIGAAMAGPILHDVFGYTGLVGLAAVATFGVHFATTRMFEA